MVPSFAIPGNITPWPQTTQAACLLFWAHLPQHDGVCSRGRSAVGVNVLKLLLQGIQLDLFMITTWQDRVYSWSFRHDCVVGFSGAMHVCAPPLSYMQKVAVMTCRASRSVVVTRRSSSTAAWAAICARSALFLSCSPAFSCRSTADTQTGAFRHSTSSAVI